MEEMMREDHVNAVVNKSKRLERELVKSQQQAQENENAAAILNGLLQKGQARVNEKGEFELLDPERMGQFQQANIIMNKEDAGE